MTDPPESILQAIAKEPEWHRFYLLELYSAIAQLPAPSRVALAACSAERLYSVYQSLTAEIGVEEGLRPLLEDAWRHALGRPLTESEVEAGRALCLTLPLGEEGCHNQQGIACNAVDATFHSLGACRRDDIVSAYYAAKSVIDAAYGELFELIADEGELTIIEPEQNRTISRQIAQSQLWKTELSLQLALLGQLKDTTIDRDRLLAMIASVQPIGEWSIQS